MYSPQEIDVQDIDHLGIIAGIVDEIGIVEIVDRLLGTHEQENVSCGQVVKALILNGMGFLSAPLYLFSEFFESKATEHLLGQGVLPEHLNDTRIGRVLDKLYAYGVTQIFIHVAMAVVQKFDVALRCAHLDATSLSVEGQYLDKPQVEASDESPSAPESPSPALAESEEPIPVKITYGYSRDNRRDLKQFVLNLLVSGDGGIPLFLQVGNGNDADKSTFVPIIHEFKQQWSQQQPEVIVADSALYSADNLQALGSTSWISRVPASSTAAQDLLQGLPGSQFHPSALNGYSFVEVCSTYGEIQQRWLVVESKARRDSGLKQVQKRIDQAFSQKTTALKTLCKQTFLCPADALAAAQDFGKILRYHTLDDLKIHKKPHYSKAGRPTKATVVTHYTYSIEATLTLNEPVIERYRRQAGRFILATNLLEQEQWSNDDILREYKNQQACEGGFRFIKDPLFFASSVFLKTPRRIAALAMIMALCLMVYSLGQRQLRNALEQVQTTLPNQKGKQTMKPTLRWILQCFQAVHLVWLDGAKHLIKLNSRQQLILPFLGKGCKKYYLLC
ncbi:IS1634 family transposase [Acaryochloris marina]|nr:IS1634 family transposase [Acaryochloris marina]QUY40626.1 IS1634 family transposase [Acaryochloris marina S15]QUY41437.1 IS1634 family transposase [Acaryochloris marina S15]QUY41832.1 IS1634 family transposase [Acaryochloris marina S15]QUY42450.1 IS1634 family transposase [Acaryochloris marina S15]QUY42959.1 IS1634 family transposase [Acaryochloris marina S15]